MLTSSASDDDIAKAYELGANAYLVKPSKIDQLEEAGLAIKQFWLTHNRPPPMDGERLLKARDDLAAKDRL